MTLQWKKSPAYLPARWRGYNMKLGLSEAFPVIVWKCPRAYSGSFHSILLRHKHAAPPSLKCLRSPGNP